MVAAVEGKFVVLDDANAVLILEGVVDPEQVREVNQMLKTELPNWNIVVFGGMDGEIIDLRNRPELAAQARELYEQVWASIERIAKS